MTSARLLALALFLCSIPVFAQDPPQKLLLDSQKAAATPEPWRFLPLEAANANVPQDPLARLLTSQPPRYKSNQGHESNVLVPNPGQNLTLSLNPDSKNSRVVDSMGRLADDTTCLAIRSYVVARDSKDSDSTHLVHYSTCQPASRYQLRTAVGSSDR